MGHRELEGGGFNPDAQQNTHLKHSSISPYLDVYEPFVCKAVCVVVFLVYMCKNWVKKYFPVEGLMK